MANLFLMFICLASVTGQSTNDPTITISTEVSLAATSTSGSATETNVVSDAPTTLAAGITSNGAATAAATTTAAPAVSTGDGTESITSSNAVTNNAAETTTVISNPTDAHDTTTPSDSTTTIASISNAAASSSLIADTTTNIASTISNVETTSQEATQSTAESAILVTTSAAVDGTTSNYSMEATSSSGDQQTTEALTTVAKEVEVPAEMITVCGYDVENVSSSSPCHPDNHKEVKLVSTDKLSTNEWLLFATGKGNCQYIPMFKPHECYQPVECDAKYPYYLSGTNDLPGPSASTTADLCTTTNSASGTAKCCQEEVSAEIYNCDDKYSLYKLSVKMTAEANGNVCLSSTKDVPPFARLMNDSQPTPKDFKELKDEEKLNVVIIVVIITDVAKYKENFATSGNTLKVLLIAEIKEILNKRQKRSTSGSGKEPQVEILAGYPTVNEDDQTADYAVLATDADGQPVPKKDVESAVDKMKDDPLTKVDGFSVSKSAELPENLAKHLPPKPDEPTDPEKPKGSKLWTAILIIIGVTAFIVALAFIGVWCYSFSRRGRSGTMNVPRSKGLVGNDELNNSYTPTAGHVNVALEDDGEVILDTNQNANGKPSKDNNTIEMQPVDEKVV